MRCKQIVSEICLQDFTLPRLLKIPERATPPETDVTNLQLAVLDLLTVDSELQALTSSLMNLGLDISAFNTQKRVWDVLSVDSQVNLPYSCHISCLSTCHPFSQVYLPYGARVKITLKTEEKVQAPTPLPRKKKDPRRTSLLRDPRRKAASVETALLRENNPGAKEEEPGVREEEKVVEELRDKEIGIEEEKIEKPENLLVEMEKPGLDNMEEEKTEKCENLLQILKALPLPVDPEMEERKEVVCIEVESDSDDEKLQIDESFEDTTTGLPDPAPHTREGHLAKLQRYEDTKKVGGIGNNGNQPFAAAGADARKGEREEEDVTIVKEMKLPLDMRPPLKAAAAAEKSPDQLEVERELLRKLVEEREMLKATLAKAGVLQEDLSINFDEVEEGELSDSCDKEDEDRGKIDSLSALGNPDNPEPIENRFKKYWDDFPEDQG